MINHPKPCDCNRPRPDAQLCGCVLCTWIHHQTINNQQSPEFWALDIVLIWCIQCRVVSSKRGSVVPQYCLLACLLAYLNTFLLMLETTLIQCHSSSWQICSRKLDAPNHNNVRCSNFWAVVNYYAITIFLSGQQTTADLSILCCSF